MREPWQSKTILLASREGAERPCGGLSDRLPARPLIIAGARRRPGSWSWSDGALQLESTQRCRSTGLGDLDRQVVASVERLAIGTVDPARREQGKEPPSLGRWDRGRLGEEGYRIRRGVVGDLVDLDKSIALAADPDLVGGQI